MLKVLIGYYDFIFDDYECDNAITFAKIASRHLSKEDSKREISITFVNEEEEEK